MDVVVHHVKGALLIGRDGTSMRKPWVAVRLEVYEGADGAGDAFAAGFLYGHHQAWTFERSLALAHAAAAASLRSITTRDTVESVATCLALAERWSWR